MLLALLEKIPIKILINLLVIFILFFIGFGFGWHFCNLKADKKYKIENNYLINEINTQNKKNDILSQAFHKNLSDYKDNMAEIAENVKNENNKSDANSSCKLSRDSLQQLERARIETNKIKSS